jgi:hypothetical protein
MIIGETLPKHERVKPPRLSKDQFLEYLTAMKLHLPDLEARFQKAGKVC